MTKSWVVAALCLVSGPFGAWAQTSLDDGVSYDVASETLSYVPATPPAQEAAANHGSGELITDFQLSEEELERLHESAPLYAPYETVERPAVEETFIPFSVICHHPPPCTREDDERVVIHDTTQFPARAVVRMSFNHGRFGDRRGCTGAMISERVVLTAGHCVHSGGDQGVWHRNFLVYPGANGAVQPFGNCGVVRRLYALNGWLGGKGLAQQRDYDLGAIELDCDVGARTGWYELAASDTIAPQTPIAVTGYPCLLIRPPPGRLWRSVDQVRERTASKIFYDNDTTGCTSGAPVTPLTEASIVAIHTNGPIPSADGPWTRHNGGTLLTAKRIESIEAWIGATP